MSLATLFDIRSKRRSWAVGIVSPADFALRQNGTIATADALARPNVSLYCLDEHKRQALFVETPPDIDLRREPFYYQAQYRHAVRVFGIPYEALEEWTDRPERAEWDELTLIYSVGRCGSTLLSRMLGRVSECLSLSEPDVYAQLVGLGLPEAEVVRRLGMVTRCLWRPTPGQTHLVIKHRSMGIELAGAMMQAFPNAHNVFLCRNAEAVVASSMRAFLPRWSWQWAFELTHQIPILRMLPRRIVKWHYDYEVRLLPFMRRFTANEISDVGPVGMFTMAWVSAMDRCLTLLDAGLPILPLRYEDLLDGPVRFAETLFEFCRLNRDYIPEALAAMHDDAQGESFLARDKGRSWKMTDRHRAMMKLVLERHPVIRTPDFELPGMPGLAGRRHA